MKPLFSTVTLVLAFSLVSGPPAHGGTDPVKLVRLSSGGLQPQAVVQEDGVVHLVYLKGDPRACDVIYSRREAGQTNFLRWWMVNSQPGSAIAVGTVRGAQFALGRNNRVHVAWNGSDQTKPGGSPMLYARMKEAGEGFEAQRNLMTASSHLDGGGSVAADKRGNVYVIWHGHPTGGPPDELHRAVFMAKSTDDGKTFSPERRINPEETGACGCCGLKAFVNEKGDLAILYRSAAASGGRDVTLLHSLDQAATFQSQIVGAWQVTTCPMSTMALGPAEGDSFLGMWETRGTVYYEAMHSFSAQEEPRTVLTGRSNQKHPVFARNARGEYLMAWTEGTAWAKGGDLAWQVLGKGGSQIAKGRAEGVPVWGGVAAIAEPDGGFTVFY